MPRKSTRPTVATIAGDLGISAATVSYALNDKPGVSAALRERVLEHARTVGWTPHSGAQALRRGRSGNIGLVLVRDPEEVSREPFYSSVTAGIESATSAHGYELMVRFVTGGGSQEAEVFRTWARQRRVDGVVLLDLAQDDPRPALLESLNLAFGLLGHYQGPENFVRVESAEWPDARTVIDHLLERGYDGCIQLTGPAGYAHEERRRTRIQELCAEHGLPHSWASGRYTIDGGRSAFAQADCAVSARPAIIASSDLLAIGALRSAQEAGIDVPRQLGLISWDDSLIAEVTSPAITALSRRPFEMGHSVGDLLVRQIEGQDDIEKVLEVAEATLIPRASTGS
ncbi:LacI family DNA-binding transcriptional regulator [Brachybacterium sp. AOP42-C2-15]